MKKSHLAALAASIGLTFTLNAGHASFVLTLDDLGTPGVDITVIDELGAGGVSTGGIISTSADVFAGQGTVTYAGSVGSFNVNVTTGTSKPVLAPGVMDLNSINVSSGAGGTLVISLTDTSFSGNPPAYAANYGGTTTGTVDFDFWHDPGNAEFGGASILPVAPISVVGPSFSGSTTNAINPGSPYSLSIFATINHGDGFNNTSFDAELRPVPIPAAVWLFGSGLLGIVSIARRKKA